MKNILIVGANFNNKGAQAMLFVTVDEIRKRFPNSKVYFGGVDKWRKNTYTFDQVYYRDYNKAIAMKSAKGIRRCLKTVAKDVAKTVTRRGAGFSHLFDLKKIIPGIDLMIDISGFNIGKQWAVKTQEDYFDNIRLAKAYHIPMILMPQSFGPFDYEPGKRFLFDEAKELLQYPRVIYARETDSKRQLEENFGLTNVLQSTDLVLQNRGVDLNSIFVKAPEINVPKLAAGAVGIVPNAKCISQGNIKELLPLYREIIRRLRDKGRTAYIFRHSSNDARLCNMIYAENRDLGNVEYINRDFNCFEYSAFVRQFDFIVCSRYHGIVNAYRESTPAIILGWAEKYRELAKTVGQENYQFDITGYIPKEKILAAVDAMTDNCMQEKEVIRSGLESIQEKNCFDILDSLLT